jgi:predicted MFS family arabinose efflux permease
MAWTADLARPGRVALALGTMLMSLEVGIGVGAVFSGYQFQGDLSAISSLYAFAGGLGLFGFVVLLIFRNRVPDPQGDAVRAT